MRRFQRVLSCLLVLVMALTVLPMTGYAAPAEEAGTVEDLYVTEGLTLLLSAYDPTSVDLAGGVWTATVGENATIVGGRYDGAANPTGWQLGKDGGLGYYFADIATFASMRDKVGLQISPAAMPDGKNFTVEMVFDPHGISPDGVTRVPHTEADKGSFPWGAYTGGVSAFNLAGFQMCYFHESNCATSNHSRMFYSKAGYDAEGHKSFSDANGGLFKKAGETALAPGGMIMTVTRSLSASNNTFTFSTALGTQTWGSGTTLHANAEVKQSGYVFYGFPATVYSIRVYDRFLTAEEKIQNHFADLAGFYELDVSKFTNFDSRLQTIVYNGAASYTIDPDNKAANKAALQELIASAQAEADKEDAANAALREEISKRPSYDKYYVQDGLSVWLDSFVSLKGCNENIDLEKGTWKSKVGDAVATLGGGDEYWKSYGGYGIGYAMTKGEWKMATVDGSNAAGVFLDTKYLPMDTGYTLEMVFNPVGLTNPDGTRYTDPGGADAEVWGIYTDAYSAFSFGPFKSMGFVCRSNSSRAGQLALRWCYTAKEWNQHNGGEGYTHDSGFSDSTGLVPMSFAVVKDRINAASDSYTVYYNMEESVRCGYTTIVDNEPEFELMHGWPGVVYNIRLYTRVLTDAERSQNHVADLMSYYALETEFYDIVLASLSDKASFYALFDDMDFSLSKEEAAKEFRMRMGGAWMFFNGLSARLDGTTAVRGEFALNDAAIDALVKVGYQVEAGILLNVESAGAPTLDQADYTYVLLKDGQKDESLVIGEKDGMTLTAVAVRFQYHTPMMAVESLDFAGYIILTDPTGEKTVIYTSGIPKAVESNLFSVYRHLSLTDAYESNAFIKGTVDSCFEKAELLVDAANGKDTNNGLDAPVQTLAKAYELLLTLLEQEAPIDVTISFADGTYVTEETLVVDASQVKQKYFRIHYQGSEASVISSNLSMSTADFKPVAGEKYYAYQFAPNAEGKYPDFRFLYVNGEMATLAHQGYTRPYHAQLDGTTMLRNQYELFCNEQGQKDPSGAYKLYLPASLFEGVEAEDFAKMEYHMLIAWYYRMMHLERIDRNDTAGNGAYIAAHFVYEEAAYWGAQHGAKGQYYWLSNSLAFLDEPGEYYYDDEAGTLYYYPAEDVDMATAKFEYPTLSTIFSFQDCQNVDFAGLTFTGTDSHKMPKGFMGNQGSMAPALIDCKNATNFTLTECTFRDIGGTAFASGGVSKGITISTCVFERIGSAGISFGNHASPSGAKWDPLSHANENIVITDNYMNEIGTQFRNSVGIIVTLVKNLEISYNTIQNTSYSAISVGWNWSEASWKFGEGWNVYGAEIYCNYFESFMTDLADGGAIYTLGGNVENRYTEHFNFMHDNYAWCTEKTGDGKGILMPYYHDGASSNWHTYSNALVMYPGREVLAPIYIQNIVGQKTHNIMVEDNHIVGVLKDWVSYKDGVVLGDLEQERVLFGLDSTRDPFMQEDGIFSRPTRIDADRNIYQQGNQNYDQPADLSDEALAIMSAAGSSLMMADVDAMFDTMDPVYAAYYRQMAEDYANQ